MNTDRLSSPRLAAFVSPEAPFAAFLMALVVYIPPFYAGSVGLGLGTVGAIFGLTKLWDVITDPVFGIISDRWHTRWGRRMPWLIASVPLLSLCTYMVFVPGSDVGETYFVLWMILLYIGWTIGTVSHISWAAELSTEYHERSRISAYKQAAALIGSLGLVALAAVSETVNGTDEVARMNTIAIALVIVLPITVIAAILSAPKIDQPAPTKNQARIQFRFMFKNRPLLLLLITNLLLGIAAGGTAGMLLFYVEDVLLLGSWASLSLVPFIFSGLLFLPAFVMLSRKIGKHRTLCYALIYQIVSSLLLLVLPSESVLLAGIAFLFVGASQAVGTYIPRAIMADVTDVNLAESGVQKTGYYMSLLQSSSKIAAALAIGISYPVLSMIGFDASLGASNSANAIIGLRMMLVLFPGAIFLIIILLMWNFPLTEERVIELRKRISKQQ